MVPRALDFSLTYGFLSIGESRLVISWLLIVYATLVIGTLAWGVRVGLSFRNTLVDTPLPDELPLVSTIVPARNEERNIGRCVHGLSHQEYHKLDLIFVDDDSEDATPEILASYAARDSRITIVHTKGKPSDWNGKQWACHSGAEAAKGGWLCFMDADTYAEPQLISRTLAFALANKIDMLTLQPWYEMRGLWERIVLPAALTPLFVLFPPHRVNNPKDTLAIANGQFILIRKEVYDAIEGHAGVRQQMMDDFSLAVNAKRAGYRLFMVDGSEVMRVRLYTNLREIRNGSLKAAVEITGGWLSSLIGTALNVIINILPVFLLLWSLVSGQTTASQILAAVVVLQLLYYSAARTIAFRAPPWSGITYPIGGIIVTVILIDGMTRLVTGREIKWKGRDLLGRPDISPRVPGQTK